MMGAQHADRGNQTAIGSYAFAYDGESRMATAQIGGGATAYGYDGDGRRVMKQTGTASPTYYVYDAFGRIRWGGDAALHDVLCVGGPSGEHAGADGCAGECEGAARLHAVRRGDVRRNRRQDRGHGLPAECDERGRQPDVFEGEFYGPPKPDPKLPEDIRRVYRPGWDSGAMTKIVVHEIISVKSAPPEAAKQAR